MDVLLKVFIEQIAPFESHLLVIYINIRSSEERTHMESCGTSLLGQRIDIELGRDVGRLGIDLIHGLLLDLDGDAQIVLHCHEGEIARFH